MRSHTPGRSTVRWPVAEDVASLPSCGTELVRRIEAAALSALREKRNEGRLALRLPMVIDGEGLARRLPGVIDGVARRLLAPKAVAIRAIGCSPKLPLGSGAPPVSLSAACDWARVRCDCGESGESG